MEIENIGIENIWLVAGAVLVALEVFAVPLMGFLFGGLAAITVGILILANVVGESVYLWQFACFFALTVVWAVALWKPLKNLRSPHPSNAYNNMVGSIAIVGAGGLKKGKTGKVAWSGTQMSAELLADAAADELPAGAETVIVKVSGTTLVVKPR